ncbi:MAG: DUF2798 domain-containing protein [Planctomycetaceae bacterium]|nr:DUF2798 domain-containing protein [Planctomycetaceae bacterium]MCP4775348.1 DUF2798 domain-containing protein [Planctomycetaceae bacterium]
MLGERLKTLLVKQRIRRTALVPKKYENQVFAFFMSLLMSCLMSLVICIFNFGLVEDLLLIWLKAWLFAFVVALPTIVLVSPLVRKLVSLVMVKD